MQYKYLLSINNNLNLEMNFKINRFSGTWYFRQKCKFNSKYSNFDKSVLKSYLWRHYTKYPRSAYITIAIKYKFCNCNITSTLLWKIGNNILISFKDKHESKFKKRNLFEYGLLTFVKRLNVAVQTFLNETVFIFREESPDVYLELEKM